MGKNFDVPAYKAPINVYMNNDATKYAGECTTYAWGRAYERLGSHRLPNTSAGNWYNSGHGYSKTTSEPTPPAIGCFSGHVTFIEQYDPENGMVVFSEANWYNDGRLNDGKWHPDPAGTDGVWKYMYIKDFKSRTGGGSFQGFIDLR